VPGFDNLYRKYQQLLFRYAKKFIDSDEDAADIVQDIFMTVYIKLNKNENDAYIKAYLFNAVRNRCLNHIKHARVIRNYEKNRIYDLKEMEVMFYSSGEKSLIEKESYLDICKAINSLTDVHKEIIILSRLEGLKNKEIAEKLQVPLRTVETRLFRALSQLREELTLSKLFIMFLQCRLKHRLRKNFNYSN